ncbi:hypothetical protein ABIE45_004710 [Methylobacterium sp. OAE515]|uniref:hypothetical protein n=1 Tax=Methylobacterium sp. OAE515 TaxID=2817895 RepID=UPI0017890CC6
MNEDAIWKTAAAVMAFDVDGVTELRLKHANGQRGVISSEDILNGVMRVIDRRTLEISIYESVEAMVLDGWLPSDV